MPRVFLSIFRRDHGIIINYKNLYRLCKRHGHQLKRPKKKQSKFGKMAGNHKVTRITQFWEFDIKYGYLNGERRFFFYSPLSIAKRGIYAGDINKKCPRNRGLTRNDELILKDSILDGVDVELSQDIHVIVERIEFLLSKLDNV